MKFLYFSAPWCGPCKMLGPKIDQMVEAGEIIVQKVDIDSEETLTATYKIRSIPQLVLVNDNMEELGRLIGAKPAAAIKELWNEHAHGTTEHTSN